MFTGLIETTGMVQRIEVGASGMKRVLVVPQQEGFTAVLGDSIAVDGCCLTVAGFEAKGFWFDVSSETLSKTIIDQYKPQTAVNLERAMRLGDRLGGHMVSGHVDGLGEVKQVTKNPEGTLVTVTVPAATAKLIVPKGSICINGVSLTVNQVAVKSQVEVSLMLIPVTLAKTNLQYVAAGQKVNFELDLIGKYIAQMVQPYQPTP